MRDIFRHGDWDQLAEVEGEQEGSGAECCLGGS
jgi:hypothetical protein